MSPTRPWRMLRGNQLGDLQRDIGIPVPLAWRSESLWRILRPLMNSNAYVMRAGRHHRPMRKFRQSPERPHSLRTQQCLSRLRWSCRRPNTVDKTHMVLNLEWVGSHGRGLSTLILIPGLVSGSTDGNRVGSSNYCRRSPCKPRPQ